MERTKAQNMVKEIKQYQKKWLQHVQRMNTDRILKKGLQHRPKGRRA
jgi:histone H3/H4